MDEKRSIKREGINPSLFLYTEKRKRISDILKIGKKEEKQDADKRFFNKRNF